MCNVKIRRASAHTIAATLDSGEHHFTTTSEIVENPGPWYYPIFGSLITAASRLLLAMLERSVTDQGGTYLFCDTDSMGIVASRFSKVYPCPGGAHRTLDGCEAVKALSWKEVEQIVQDFSKLNPYDRNIVKDSILKIEDVNFDRLNDGFPLGVDQNKFTVIAPYCSDQDKWYQLNWVNIYDGKVFRLGRPGLRLSYEVNPKSYGDVIRDYQKHPEAKSLAPDESICASGTAGLLRRTPVTAADEFAFIGKETDRRWEREEDISLIESRVTQYRRDETQLLVADPRLSHKARQTSIRKLAKASNVSEKTVKAFRRGKRIRKATLRKLERAMKSGPIAKSKR